ncbi:unnamed protein product [Clavelina lepadiformis]|uniref:Uncharacterized protein n=1 Tax=Clavelina lepadiformis TaxID=159417 RepID=A0ABP0GUY3_CLALP
MSSLATTAISPPQHLLTTIYRQSWHPVASAQGNYSPKRPMVKDVENIAGSLRKTESPFEPKPSYAKMTKSSIQKRRQSPGGRRVNSRSVTLRSRSEPTQCGKNVPQLSVSSPIRMKSCNETPYTLFTESSLGKAQVTENEVPTSLATWRRRLKTCVTSSSRTEQVKTSGCESPSTASQTPKNRMDVSYASGINGHNLPVSVPNTRFYKLLNFSNPVLATICVQGLNPPVQERAERSRRTSEYTDYSQYSTVAAYDDEHANLKGTISYSSSSEKDPFDEEIDNDVNTSQSFSTRNLEDDSSEVSFPGDLALGSFADDKIAPEMLLNGCRISEKCMATIESKMMPTSRSLTLEDSDISENEISSDGEDDDSLSFEGSEKHGRSCIEKYKQLYERENRSNVAASDPGADKPGDDMQETSYDCQLSESDNKTPAYEFADVFPKKFEKYDIRMLSKLPYDVNWRSVVNLTELCSGSDRKHSQRRHSVNSCKARRAKALEERKSLENLIERLINLDKLQTSTEQRELAIKYHRAHIRSIALKQKTSSGKNLSSSSMQNENKSSDLPASGFSTSRESPRRRSSVPSVNSRLAWVSEMSQGDNSVLEQACKNGDLTLLHDNWLASIKNRIRPTSEANRRFSESSRSGDPGSLSKRGRRPRSRPTLPRYYVYEWSERTKDDRYRLKTSCKVRAQPCATCREKARRMQQSNVAVASQNEPKLRRPSTACSVTSQSPSRPIPSKARGRHQAAVLSSANLPHSTPAITNYHKFSENVDVANFNSTECLNEHMQEILMQKEKLHLLSNSGRNGLPTYLSSAFKVSSIPFNNRPKK